jgi:hypothetical protein
VNGRAATPSSRRRSGCSAGGSVAGFDAFARLAPSPALQKAICQWFNVLHGRSERRSALKLSTLTNPWLAVGPL